MPYRRRTKRTRRRPRRRRKAPRYRNLGSLQTHRFKKKVMSTITLDPTVLPLPKFLATSFQLSDLPEAATFARLYQRYRIDKIHVNAFMIDFQAPALNQALQVAWCTDYDDLAAPVDWSDFLCRTDIKTKTLTAGGNINNSFNITLRPKVSAMLYESVASTAYAPVWKTPFVSMLDPQTPFRGIRIGFNNGTQTLNVAQTMSVTTTYWITMQSPQ